MRIIFSFLICFSLLWQTAVAQPLAQLKAYQPLHNHTPQQEVVFVSPLEFEKIKGANPTAQEYYLNEAESKVFLAQLNKDQNASDKEKRTTTPYRSSGASINPPRVSVGSSGGNNDGLALIILVFVSVVIVVAIVVYTYKFIDEAVENYGKPPLEIKNQEPKLEYFALSSYSHQWMVGFESYHFTPDDEDRDKSIKESGFLGSTRYRIERNGSSPNFGLQLEIGMIDGTFILEDAQSVYNVKSVYALFGPTVNFDLKKNQQGLDTSLNFTILAGAMAEENIGLVSLARITYRSKFIESGYYLDLSLGSLYAGLQETGGLARSKNNFNLLYGGTIGKSF